MTKDEAKTKAWADWHDGIDYVPQINQLYARGFDAGWAAREAEHAAQDEREIKRLIDEELL